MPRHDEHVREQAARATELERQVQLCAGLGDEKDWAGLYDYALPRLFRLICDFYANSQDPLDEQMRKLAIYTKTVEDIIPQPGKFKTLEVRDN